MRKRIGLIIFILMILLLDRVGIIVHTRIIAMDVLKSFPHNGARLKVNQFLLKCEEMTE